MGASVRWLKGLAWIVGFTILVLPVIVAKVEAQPFPVMLVSSEVRNRLAQEWEPDNPYQHERGYCIEFTEEYDFSWTGPLVVYRLTKATRAVEESTTSYSIKKISCPTSPSRWVFLHTHPPTECEDLELESSCQVGGEYANQCFPSNVDSHTLEASDKPFSLIQCDRFAIVPYWRRLPLPAIPPPTTFKMHR